MVKVERGVTKGVHLVLLHLPLGRLCLLQSIHEGAVLVLLTHVMKGGHHMLHPRSLLLGSLASALLACLTTLRTLCHFLFMPERIN